MSLEEKIREKLKGIIDPELGLNIVDLGLIYELKVDNGKALIRMSLTTPACPYGPKILSDAKKAVENVPGVKEARVEITFNPPWNPSMASDEVKAMFENII
ncbi:MAG: aromatic ring hydroxylating enzyme [archaeon GW2011_AR10]|uniref:Metal-sulfur cluster assembly factor n=1 Tax=Candidatus Iainarchaeum sp. TaxID=3101447 RepID=A0A7J4IRD0_9ARCH|nr:MAG: aromatic ring hydroxylating enzyme [archaeon GW2011_AR10]KKR36708.1 MAG: hypothetical protein UT71_C0032G0004 [Parcubacteria group bacterium GW2011_GWF2_40_10]HIH08073.1 metal-sulfur cluster assembly factor [Candidatus Diapherotrites archaeon]